MQLFETECEKMIVCLLKQTADATASGMFLNSSDSQEVNDVGMTIRFSSLDSKVSLKNSGTGNENYSTN
jgi:hypothetical protein